MKKLKQILSNKNTVTFIGAILIVLVLYFFYNWKVNQATSPIRVPYAVQTIAPRTKITKDMIGYVDITQSSMKGNVLTNENTQILGMYTNVNSSIPSGSLFYAEQVVKEEELPDSFLLEMEDGQVAYNFSVNVTSTYGNSMYPGNYVDVYFKGIGDDGRLMIGKLVENVKILAVKDSGGRPVFETTSEERTPSQIIFGVTREIHLLLRTAEYIKNAEIILVPTNASLKVDGDEENIIAVTSETIKEYINSQAALLEDIVATDTEEDVDTNTDTNGDNTNTDQKTE